MGPALGGRPDFVHPVHATATPPCTSHYGTRPRTTVVSSVVVVARLTDADAVPTHCVRVSAFVTGRTVAVQSHLSRCIATQVILINGDGGCGREQ